VPAPRKQPPEKRAAVRDAAALIHGHASGAHALEGTGLYQLLVESVSDYAIFALAPDGTIITWNTGARRIKGYEADEVIGSHIRRFYPPEDQAKGKAEALLRAAEVEGHVEDLGWRVRKDGTLFWANVVITALHDESGALVGFAKVTRDLTERLEAERRALHDARRLAAAEASSRAKTEFLAAMSHELRTPLNAIGGYVELLQMGVGGTVTKQQAEYLDRVRTAQQHLLNLINDLLNYSRIEAGQIVYDIAPTPLRPIVERVILLVEAQATRKHVGLDHQPCADIVVNVDRLKVEQIVLNLLSNAIKFTPEDGRVVVSCEVDGGTAIVRVDDSGPGVPENQRDAIFEPFVQLGRSLTSTHEGTGLGLAISRDLARAMDGNISVSDSKLGGAAFALQLKTA
jgi:PAS domain S-box-containing protein